MKKIVLVLITIVTIGACNTPQKMTSPNGDSMMNSADSSKMMQGDSTMKKDSM